MTVAICGTVQSSFWRRVRLLLALVIFVLARPANAADKRAPQQYGAKKPSQVGPTLLWVPRVLLFPPWLVSEYVLRQPIGLLVRTAEKNQWTDAIVQFFTFGERGQVTIFPSALLDFGLKPSVGFNLKWKYFLAERNTLAVHAGTWGPDWISLRASDSYQLSRSHAVGLEGSLVNRKDLPFYGMGPRSPSSPRYRYQALTTDLAVAYRADLWRSSAVTVRAGMRSLSFGDGTCCAARSVYDAVATGDLPLPPGLGDGYVAAFQGANAALDSRRARPESGTGVRLEARGEMVEAPARGDTGRRVWASYGATTGVAVDTWRGRVVGVSVAADFADPLEGTIPFTDQVSLGGNRPMRGFLQGRLIDRSSIVASLQYTWPVWVYLDGLIQTDVGNVFGRHLSGFDPDLLRLTSGIGVRSTGDPASGLEIMVAAGTDPFEAGFHVSSFRLVLGSHHGF